MAEESVVPPVESPEDLGNPVPIILGVVGTFVVLFFVANVLLWYYAQQAAPARKSKKVGVKKIKRDAMKQGLRVLGD